MAPLDPGVLSACGNHLFHRGDLERAANLLSKAVELAPDSAMLLNSLGAVLGTSGQDNAAIACFERALQADPIDGTSYYNLAMALYPSNRHGEIISRLEAKLRDAPEFPDGLNWLGRIREALPPPNRGIGRP
jgi:tetratricopeptide (TPR) repeat protein